ncbi:MAG: HIT domain-containing protein [Alphaproteobacteria bacterium]|nr:HIT domain-containing protein [Alphaproteobacteria bacterium]
MLFSIDERLEKGKFFITNLPLCRVLLQDDSRFPWLILVPCLSDITEISSLEIKQQHTLIEEISFVSKTFQDYTKADKINIAAFGNMVPQLHIHIVARFKTDLAWPDPVIGLKGSISYAADQKDKMIDDLKQLLAF